MKNALFLSQSALSNFALYVIKRFISQALPCKLIIDCLVSHERNIKQEQCQIRLNLVIAMAVAQIIFLAGIDATSKVVIISSKLISSSITYALKQSLARDIL